VDLKIKTSDAKRNALKFELCIINVFNSFDLNGEREIFWHDIQIKIKESRQFQLVSIF